MRIPLISCRSSLLALTLLFSTAILPGAAEIKVIVNNGVTVTEISADDLKAIYLLTKKSFSDGMHAEPVLCKQSAAYAAFLKHYLDKTDDTLTNYYRNAVFTGKGLTPRSFASDAEVVAYVVKTKGAIGYVASDTALSGAKTLAVK